MSRDLARSGSKPDALATPDTPHAPVLLPLRARSRASSLLQVPQRPQNLAQTKTVPDLVQIPSQTTIKCRSELARERGVCVCVCVCVTDQSPDTPPSPASRPLRILCPPQNLWLAEIHCRSALAREGGVSVTDPSPDTPPSPASRSLPILSPPQNLWLAEIHCRSELARESGVSVTDQSPDTPPSPASRLLRILCPPQNLWLAEIHCRSALARERGMPVTNQSPDTQPSPASRPLRILCLPQNLWLADIHCRSALAREGGLSVTDPSPDTPPSRLKPVLPRVHAKSRIRSRVSASASVPPPSTGFSSSPDTPSAPGSAPPAHWST